MKTPSPEAVIPGLRLQQRIANDDELLADTEKILIFITLTFSGNAQ